MKIPSPSTIVLTMYGMIILALLCVLVVAYIPTTHAQMINVKLSNTEQLSVVKSVNKMIVAQANMSNLEKAYQDQKKIYDTAMSEYKVILKNLQIAHSCIDCDLNNDYSEMVRKPDDTKKSDEKKVDEKKK